MITQAPRGTKDWYAGDIEIRNRVMEIARKTANNYNFSEISTPAFEYTQLFNRVGSDTDIVSKEMYTFMDKGGRSISLKPEGTASTMRAFIEHNMYAEAQPTKLFYFTQAFRYEKPSNGRLRQHHQFGCELVGSKTPNAELEVISVAWDLIKELGLKDIKLHINSIGEGESREKYKDALRKYLSNYKQCLCPTCIERMERNPLRVIDCKVAECKKIVADAPRAIDYLDDDAKKHMETLENLLQSRGIEYVIDKDIVRGLDYYTKTVFEFVDKDGFTLCGGGRYDKLINELEPKLDVAAVGFGIGIERILYFLEKEGIEFDIDITVDIYIGNMSNFITSYELATKLRNEGLKVEVDLMNRSLKAQMKYANKIGAKYTVIIGDEEVSTKKVMVKNMESGMQIECGFDEIGRIINERI